ncbi:MAG: MFS transporter [Ilumatobacteraceae bacterium]
MLGRALDSLLDEQESPEVRRDVATLTVARLCANSCYRFTAPFLATIARGVGVSLDQIGIALAIAELAGLLSPLTARLVDHLPRRLAMAFGLAGVVFGTVLAASSVGLVMFTVALVTLSQSKVMFDLGLGSWIADHVPYERRGAVVGLTETSWALALLVGVSTMGLVTAVSNWRVGYLTGALAVVLMGATVVRQLPREPKVTMHRTHAAGEKRPALALGARGWLVVAGACTLMMASQSLFVTFGSWLEDSFDFSPAAISAVVFALGLGELAASVTSARRTDRWGKETSTARGAALMVPAGILLVLGHGNLGIGVAALAIGICGFEFAIVSVLAVGSALVPGSPARGLAILLTGGTLGRAIASIPATRLYESHGMAWPAAMSAVFAACTVAAMLIARAIASRHP